MAKAQLVDKQILEKCVPIKICADIAKTQYAYTKLLDINNEIEPTNLGQGYYASVPEVLRGQERELRGSDHKDEWELKIEQLLKNFEADDVENLKQLEKLQQYALEGKDPFENVIKLIGIMNEKEAQNRRTAEERQLNIIKDIADKEFKQLNTQLLAAKERFESIYNLDVTHERRKLIGTTKAVADVEYDPDGRKTNAKATINIRKVPKNDNALMGLYQAELHKKSCHEHVDKWKRDQEAAKQEAEAKQKLAQEKGKAEAEKR